MKRMALVVTVLLLSMFAFGCAHTHYIPSECPQMEPPPTLHNVQWVKIIITNPDTGEEVVYYAIPLSDVLKETLNIEMIKEYSIRAYELNK